MAMQQPFHNPFDRIFDADLGKAFREKRRSLGVSLEQLGDHLKVHWSTLRKWETGATMMCHPRHVAVIISFLNGEYDAGLQRKYGHEVVRCKQGVSLRPPCRRRPSDRTAPVLSPQLQGLLLRELDRLFAKVLQDSLRHFR